MKKFKTILLFICFSLSLLAAKNYNVSFFNNNSLAKVEYVIAGDGKETVVDLSSVYSVSSEDRIYVDFNAGSDYIEVNSIKLRSYDGNKSDIRVTELETDSEGRLYFTLGNLGTLKEWSVEPVLERTPFVLTLESVCNGETVAGTWTVNRDNLDTGRTFEISSVTDFAVSFEYDDSSYYFVSSNPRKLAESNGKVIFSIQKAGSDSSPVLDYTINLNRYTRISLGDRKERFVKLLYKGDEYGRDEIENLKFKNGETFFIYTEKGYVVANDNGLTIVNRVATENQWVTEIKVTEDNSVFNYKINIVEEKVASFQIEFEGFTNEDLKNSNIIINVDGERLSLKNEITVEVKEDGAISIIIPRGSVNQKLSVFFYDDDGVLGRYDSEDVTKEFDTTLTYNDVKSLYKIKVTKKDGYRVSGIQSQIENMKREGMEVGYYLAGRKINDGDFLSYGNEVSVVMTGTIPEDVSITLNGQPFTGTATIVISEGTSPSDFKLDCSDKPGFWYDFSSGDSTVNGSVSYRRNGIALKGSVFINVGDKVDWVASPVSDDYMVNGNASGTITITTEDDDYQFNLGINFVKKSDTVEKTIILKQPLYGSVKYYYEGKLLSSDRNSSSDISLRISVPKKGGEVELEYEYTQCNPGFEYPVFVEQTVDGWTYTKKENNRVFCVTRMDENSSAKTFTPIECEELDNAKPELIVDVDKSVINSANGSFSLYFEQNGKRVYIYEKSKEIKDWKNKVATTESLCLVLDSYQIDEGEVLEMSWSYKYRDGKESGNVVTRTEFRNHSVLPEITGHLSKSGESANVKTISVKMKMIKASKFVERKLDKATVTLKIGETVIDESHFMADTDIVTLIVEPVTGYYIEGQDSSFVKNISYKDLDKTLKGIKIKKLVTIKLENIHPDKGDCRYENGGKELDYGNNQFREGDKITVKLGNMKGYKGPNFIQNILPKDEMSGSITIDSSLDGKTLTLDDFKIVKGKE